MVFLRSHPGINLSSRLGVALYDNTHIHIVQRSTLKRSKNTDTFKDTKHRLGVSCVLLKGTKVPIQTYSTRSFPSGEELFEVDSTIHGQYCLWRAKRTYTLTNPILCKNIYKYQDRGRIALLAFQNPTIIATRSLLVVQKFIN